MNRHLGIWSAEDCALVLTTYQPEQMQAIRSETPLELIELQTRFLIRSAKAFDVPIVVSTVGVEEAKLSSTAPSIAEELNGIEPIDHSSMAAFESEQFRDAVAGTGRKRLIMCGLHTEVCLTFAVVDALKAGYEVQFVVDAIGGRSEIAHRSGIQRMSFAGAVPNTALAVVSEWFRDWAGPLADAARETFIWWLARVQDFSDRVGVTEGEAAAANASVTG